MKRILGTVAALFITFCSVATPVLNFTISKPLCLLTFMEAASGDPQSSVTLTQYITKHVKGQDSIVLKRMCTAFSALSLGSTYTTGQVPVQRVKPKTLGGLVRIAAVQSDSLPEFYGRITGILPNEQLLVLKQVLSKVEPIYDNLIWRQYSSILEGQLTSLRQYGTETDSAFAKLKKFYNSTWSDDMPFNVSIYPIPADRGNTTASPHSNSLVMAVLTGEKDYDSEIGVAMHEICHVLYEEQPVQRQWEVDSFFNGNPSLSAQYAYNYLDEALATACGNGWIYELLTGNPDTGNWYNDAYINKYAHALYPMVKDYLAQDKTIDALFVSTAVKLFEQQFPGAAYEYDNLFSKLHFYTDAGSEEQYRNITNTLYKHFKVYSCNSSYPIVDEKSLDMAENSKGTQLFVVHTKHKENLTALKKIFPQLNKAKENDEAIISFIDDNKRPIVIVSVKEADRISDAFKKMTTIKSIKPVPDIVRIN